MDHYTYPAEPIYPRVKVPCLLSQDRVRQSENCRQNFSTFPLRNGWKKAEFLDGKLHSGTPEQASEFLQEWLFFGLAGSVLNLSPKLLEQLILRDEDGTQAYISTSSLPEFINEWMEDVVDYNTVNAQEAVKAASLCLDEASVFCLAASADLKDYRLEKIQPEVRLSIMALGDQLQSALRLLEIKLGSARNRLAAKTRDYFGDKSFIGKAASKMSQVKSFKESFLKSRWEVPYAPDVEKSSLYFGDTWDDMLYYLEDKEKPPFLGPWKWGNSIILQSRLREAQWCRYEAARIQDILSPWAVHYVSAMSRPSLYDHSVCTESHCNAHTIDESTYSTQHVQSDCTCPFIGIDQEKVKRILKAKQHPIVLINTDSEGQATTVDVRSYNGIPALGALWPLSHVWSHGLGNAISNTLPTCQLTRLVKIGGKVRDDNYVWLWIDTLCVPLDKNLRKDAILQMGDIYKNSSGGTVVVDKELIQTPCQDLKHEEVLLRLICCSWMQRMWTMQEGARERVSLVFADGQMDLTATLRHYQLHNPLYPISKGGFAFDMMTQMTHASNATKSDAQIMRIWNGMRWRQATKPGDEAIILASLLFPRQEKHLWSPSLDRVVTTEPFDLILWTKDETRWATLFRTRRTWPQGIVFVNCRTIPERGLRWAPSEIGTYGREIAEPVSGSVSQRGLTIKRPGYIFHPIRKRLAEEFEFQDVQTGEWYAVSRMERTDVVAWPEPTGEVAFALVQSKRLAGYAKIPAVLGRVEEVEDEVVPLEFACKVYVSKVFQERKAELDRLIQKEPERRFGAEQILATAKKEEQMWCVG
ncbi:hypothetical protein K461DRAFT_298423 [Myriangium duriaei CBS 260.36]|uniref:Heterokaryon incompatibility domain-containing protein n=1 Tax=Myriangium duriaei CBS 260.36 TaxID=1168546 RepID=A0A9P4MFD1_9PEZI|nr:hypothetical protein K461DRAFT_298423 [Myriangium duriaei CBS 260.36]